jgi:hypothetical protein
MKDLKIGKLSGQGSVKLFALSLLIVSLGSCGLISKNFRSKSSNEGADQRMLPPQDFKLTYILDEGMLTKSYVLQKMTIEVGQLLGTSIVHDFKMEKVLKEHSIFEFMGLRYIDGHFACAFLETPPKVSR